MKLNKMRREKKEEREKEGVKKRKSNLTEIPYSSNNSVSNCN